tara:strand:+ start:85 stop:258 length:174 start_codon:yes stop_codon:yes gene_type:complete
MELYGANNGMTGWSLIIEYTGDLFFFLMCKNYALARAVVCIRKNDGTCCKWELLLPE